MTSATEMKKFLNTLQKNKWFYLYEIHHSIENHMPLDEDDIKSHNDSGCIYEKWKQTLQGILSDYKKKGLVDHIDGIPAKAATDGIAKDPQYLFKEDKRL